MAKRLFVGSLSFNTTAAQLEELFAQQGKVASVTLIMDKFSGQSKGFAFVEMASDEEALKAIKALNNYNLDGRAIVVNEARPREDRGNSFGSGGGNRQGSQGGYQRSGKKW